MLRIIRTACILCGVLIMVAFMLAINTPSNVTTPLTRAMQLTGMTFSVVFGLLPLIMGVTLGRGHGPLSFNGKPPAGKPSRLNCEHPLHPRSKQDAAGKYCATHDLFMCQPCVASHSMGDCIFLSVKDGARARVAKMDYAHGED